MQSNNLTILAADNDLEDLELIEDAILNAQPGARLEKVTNGNELIKYLSSCKDNDLPCLIILDYNMPELNGSQLLAIISKQPRYTGIPKVILSTSNAPFHVQECLKNGATDYFVKPDNIRDLYSIAKKMLDFCRSN
jgi:CheY-like chemotaxis protein